MGYHEPVGFVIYTMYQAFSGNTDLGLSIGLLPFGLGPAAGILAFFRLLPPTLDALIVGH